MSQKSIQDVIRQQEAQREARRQSEIREKLQREQIISEQRERARQEYIQRQLLERVVITPTSPSPGAGGGSLLTQIGSTYWALLFSPDSVSGQNYTPQSMGRDSNGNIYVGSIDSSNSQKSIIRKLSTLGNLIWEKTLFNSNANADMELSRILVLPNSQGVVCLYKSGLRKLDTNGNVSWTFIHNISTDTLNLTSLVLNLTGDAIYVFGTKDNDTSFELAQFDLSTGAISNNKLLIVDGSFFCKAYADIGLDSSGNILIPLANATVPPFYNTTVIKVEPLISTGGASILGTWTLLESSYGNNRQDVAALAVDSSNSVVLHGYSRGITKIAADLDGAIAVTLDIVLGSEAWDSSSLAVSSDDSIFVVGDYGPKLKIVKLSNSLLPQFSYTIESLSGSLSLQGWWSANANSSIEIVDDIMLITAGYNSGLGVQELLLKLPLTNMSGYPEYNDRTYGDFKFTNHPITQDNVSITTTIVNPITTDSTWIVEDNGLEASLTQPANSQTITETSLY
jgi:hypothetical protein